MQDAPRLWYLQLKEIIEEICFEDIKIARATFVLYAYEGDTKELIGMLAVHVDDGIVFGHMEHPVYREARKQLNLKLNIKKWKQLKDLNIDYLGMQWSKTEDDIVVNMQEYMDKLEVVNLNDAQQKIARENPSELPPEELRFEYKSVHVKVRWPVSHVMPAFAYRVSKASPKSRELLTYEDVMLLNNLVEDDQECAEEYGC